MISAVARRAAQRNVGRTAARRWAHTEPMPGKVDLSGNAFIRERQAIEAHAGETMDLWRKVSYYICLPAIAVGSVWVYKVEMEHKAHAEHEREANGGELPEVPAYEHLNRRVKPFPWGMNSLFFNPEVNKNMSDE